MKAVTWTENTAWNDPAFLASIATARQQAAQGKTVSDSDLKKELGIDG